MRECSRKRPMTERTRMFSESPSMPGFRPHTPRTMRSIFTPACEAAYSSSMMIGSRSEFILATMCAGLPSAASLASLRIAATTRRCRLNGDCQTCRSFPRAPGR